MLNPTGGVKAKDIEIDKALVYKKDSSRPGGGVFIAESRGGLKDFSDCPAGLIITKDDNAMNMGKCPPFPVYFLSRKGSVRSDIE